MLDSSGGIFLMNNRLRSRELLGLNKSLEAMLSGSGLQNDNESSFYELSFLCENVIVEQANRWLPCHPGR